MSADRRFGRRISTFCIAAATIAGVLAAPSAQARSILEGPIPAFVVRIIDGDTIEVRAQIWLEQEILVKIRLAGIDTPELTATCEEARMAARQARDLLTREIEGARVLLLQIQGGKYFGRVIGRVVTPRGEDLSQLLLQAGLAVPYAGGRRSSGC